MTSCPRLAALLLLSTTIFCAPALALAPSVTPEGAQKLQETLQAYFGKPAAGEASVVLVAPNGTNYKVTLDPARLLKPLENAGFKMEMRPYEFTLADQGDGTWKYASNISNEFSFKGGGLDQKITITNGKSDGIFDVALGYFRSGTYSIQQVTSDATGPQGHQVSSYGPVQYTMSSVPAGSSAATIEMKGTLGTYSMDIAPPGTAKGATGGHVAIKLASADIYAKLDGMHARDILDLWAFFVAHPDKPAIASAQADLKALLRKALPLFANISETVSFKDMAVDTALGNFGGKDFGFGLDVSGAVPDAHYAISLKGSSLSLPKALIPAWANGFLPTMIDIAPVASGMNFEAAAKEMVEDFTLNGDKFLADADGLKISQALMPSGSVKVALAKAHLVSPLLDVHVDGEMNLGPARQAGTATITASGMDAALDALKAAMGTDKNAAQAFGLMSVAKGLGKPAAGGALSWVVELTPERKFIINGAPFGGK